MYEIHILNDWYEETECYATLQSANAAKRLALADPDTYFVYGPSKVKKED